MVSSITGANHVQSAASTAAPVQRPKVSTESGQSHPAAAPTDTVQLSSAAQAMLAAVQEARETPAQTSHEALGGDRQAQRLLAKQAAAKAVGK
jgi:hypothetical protein